MKFGAEKVIQLVEDDQPLAGRIVNVDGQPVRGATIRMQELAWNQSGTLDEWEKAVKHEKADYYSVRNTTSMDFNGHQLASVVPPVTTDQDGHFTMRGIGLFRRTAISKRSVHDCAGIIFHE